MSSISRSFSDLPPLFPKISPVGSHQKEDGWALVDASATGLGLGLLLKRQLDEDEETRLVIYSSPLVLLIRNNAYIHLLKWQLDEGEETRLSPCELKIPGRVLLVVARGGDRSNLHSEKKPVHAPTQIGLAPPVTSHASV